MVSTITENALSIKKELERAAANTQDITNGMVVQNKGGGIGANGSGNLDPTDILYNQKKRKAASMEVGGESVSLFAGPITTRSPIEAKYVHEAFRRLQRAPQPIRNFRGGLVRT
ncbi:Transcription initiation protein spt3, partial [Spiromyces aspiralis]